MLKTKLIEFEELTDMMFESYKNDYNINIDIATIHDFEPKLWINIGLTTFKDSKILVCGGYENDVYLLANNYQLNNDDYKDEIIEKLRHALMNFGVNEYREKICIEIK